MKFTCPECEKELETGGKEPDPEEMKLTCPNCGARLLYSLTEEGPKIEKAEEEQPVEPGWDLRPPGAAIIRKKKSK